MNRSMQPGPGPVADDASGFENDEKTMPLGIGEFGEEVPADPLASGGDTPRFRAGSLLLILVVVIACGGLWFMRSLSQVSMAGHGDTDLEKSIERFVTTASDTSASASARTVSSGRSAGAGVLEVLSNSYTSIQVPLDNVQRNPFLLPGEGEPVPLARTDSDSDDTNILARRRADREMAIEKAASRFVLKSIIMGAQPLANIDGKIVRVGDELLSQPENITFRVSEIIGTAVTVVVEEPEIGLMVEMTIQLRRDR